MRRLVAATDAGGRARIVLDGEVPREILNEVMGATAFELWMSDTTPPVTSNVTIDATLTPHRYFPGPGGTRFWVHRIPSRAEMRRIADRTDKATADAAHAAFLAAVPGITDHHEPEGAGMHTSSTVDYGFILEGAIDLELDDGVVTRLNAGDSYVLHAARHNWHSLEEVGCMFAVVVIGAAV